MGTAYNAGATARSYADFLPAAWRGITDNIGNGAVATGQTVGQFLGGLVSAGQGQAAPAAVPGSPVAKAIAATTPAAPKAPVYSQAYLNAQPNFVQQWNADPKNAKDQITSASPTAASMAVPQAVQPQGPQTPLDAIRLMAMNNPGLSLANLPQMSAAVSQLIPQAVKAVPQTAKEKGIARYSDVNEFALAQSLANPQWSTGDQGQAIQRYLNAQRGVLGAPSLVGDLPNAGMGMGGGMPPG
jgi:hypothetical protein